MIACPNCGGNVHFDIASQQLACEYCQNHFDPYAFDTKTSDGIESQDFEVTVFSCPQCGGEILSTDNAASGFCSFCGASTILYTRIQNEHRPNYIIPFKKTKEDCKQAYADLMKRAIFAPKELKDTKKIDSFRGIYMPYWAYYITQNSFLNIKGKKSYRSGDYIITDHYDLTGELDAYYKGISYDASSSFSDNISENLAPYDVKGMKKFTPAYFSGFYADTADVSSAIYEPVAKELANAQTTTQIDNFAPFKEYSKTYNQNGVAYNTTTNEIDYTMFPVWFMSYRNGDRVAYATVNGQTGKVVADVPVDPWKYLLGSLVLALPLFILLNIFLTLTPAATLFLTAILAVLTGITYTIEISKVVRKENDEDDIGKASKKDIATQNQTVGQKMQTTRQKASVQLLVSPMVFVIAFFVFALFIAFSGSSAIMSDGFHMGWLFVIAAAAITLVIGFIKTSKVPLKRKGFGGLISILAAIVVSSFVALLGNILIYDWFFYGAAIFAAFCIFYTIKDIIVAYNVLSTRRLPQFNKEGGNNRA